MTEGASPGRCLVPLPAALEDVLRCLPALEALAASGRRLVTLAEPEVLPILRLAAAELELLPRLAELAATRAVVRAAECREAVILSRRVDDAWLARTAGIARRWGYGPLLLPSGWFLNRRVRRPPRRLTAARPASADFRELLTAMDSPPMPSEPRLAIGGELRREARERLARAHVSDEGGPLVGLYPGVTGGGGVRPWPRRRFEELARELRRRHPRLSWIVLATAEDLWTAVRVHEETGKIHPVIGPDLRLDLEAALLAALDGVVAADSRMLTLAAAAGTRTLGLYVRDPRRWAPPGKRHRALRADKARTLAGIGLDEVMAAFEELELFDA